MFVLVLAAVILAVFDTYGATLFATKRARQKLGIAINAGLFIAFAALLFGLLSSGG